MVLQGVGTYKTEPRLNITIGESMKFMLNFLSQKESNKTAY